MRTVIVTGASSGLGRGFAEALGRLDGVEEIWVIARRTSRLEELQNTIPCRVVPISLDLSYGPCIAKYRPLLVDRNPEVVALVKAAGYGKFGEFENAPLSEQVGMIDVNVSALTSVTYLTLPYMEEGSQIYQLGSLSAYLPAPYMSVYAASKAYVLRFSQALGVELKHRKIRVLAVCPTWVRTEFIDRAAEHKDVITYFGHVFTVDEVVRRALRDMKRGKTVSICGWGTRWQMRAMKLLPHRLVMKIWCWLQKK